MNLGKTKNEIFIDKAILIHGDRYHYNKISYQKSNTKINITCPIHGDFEQTPSNHLAGKGCRNCHSNSIKKDISLFISQANQKHNFIYDYSLVEYVNSMIKVDINCKIHGTFNQSPNAHLQGATCPKCAGKHKHTTNEFIIKANSIHNNKYQYISNYVLSTDYINIICPEHGEFKQKPANHLIGQGCPKCFLKSKTKTLNNFISDCVRVHGNKYDYSLTKYTTTRNEIKIICPEHGEFKQKPTNHLKGNGCPICNESNGEREIRLFLINNNINYERGKKFNECKNIYKLSFDFYLPDLNTCIEFNGIQHYMFHIFLHKTQSKFIQQQQNDIIKKQYCNDNNIPLLIIKYDEIILNRLNELFG